MLPTVLTAFEHVKANLSSLAGLKLHTREGFYRTGLDANPALAARFVKDRPRFQGGVRQHRDQADPGSEAIGQEQAALADPAHPR